MADYNDAINLLAKLNTEETNWRIARQQLGESLEAARAAQAEVSALTKTKESIEGSIKDLEKQMAAGSKRVTDAIAQLETEKRVDLEQRMAKATAQVAVEEKRAATANKVSEAAIKIAEEAVARKEEILQQLAEADRKLADVHTAIDKFTTARG